MPWGEDAGAAEELSERLAGLGARSIALKADLAAPSAAGTVLDRARSALGPVTARVRPPRS
jgi:hypothetical protein